MSSSLEKAVDNFLMSLGQLRTSRQVLKRIWQSFMAYCMCLVAESFRRRGFTVQPLNAAQGFRFKCFPAGDPVQYSYFSVSRGNEVYEVRLNVYAQNQAYRGLRLNLDLVIIRSNSINNGLIDSQQNLISFAECKNLNGFPELVASLEGMIYNLQRRRLWRNSINNYTIPCCLMLSGSNRSIQNVNNGYVRRGNSIRIFGNIQPNSPGAQDFIQNWF